MLEAGTEGPKTKGDKLIFRPVIAAVFTSRALDG